MNDGRFDVPQYDSCGLNGNRVPVRVAARLLVAFVTTCSVLVGIAAPGGAASDWGVAIVVQPPSSAPAGDVVTGSVRVTNNAGGDTLTSISVGAGSRTVGFDSFVVDLPPASLLGGSSVDFDFAARLIGAPASTNTLEIVVTATPGAAAPETKSATVSVGSLEAVTATLSAATGPPDFTGAATTVTVTDQTKYTLAFTNASDTNATLSSVVLPAPEGTMTVWRINGSTTVASDSMSTFTLVVDVNDGLPSGTEIVATPSAQYTMSGIGLAPRDVPITPSSLTTTVMSGSTSSAPTITALTATSKKNTVVMQFAATDDTPAEQLEYQCRLDDAEWVTCDSATSHVFNEVPGGSHTVYLQVADDDANTADESRSVRVKGPRSKAPRP